MTRHFVDSRYYYYYYLHTQCFACFFLFPLSRITFYILFDLAVVQKLGKFHAIRLPPPTHTLPRGTLRVTMYAIILGSVIVIIRLVYRYNIQVYIIIIYSYLHFRRVRVRDTIHTCTCVNKVN